MSPYWTVPAMPSPVSCVPLNMPLFGPSSNVSNAQSRSLPGPPSGTREPAMALSVWSSPRNSTVSSPAPASSVTVVPLDVLATVSESAPAQRHPQIFNAFVRDDPGPAEPGQRRTRQFPARGAIVARVIDVQGVAVRAAAGHGEMADHRVDATTDVRVGGRGASDANDVASGAGSDGSSSASVRTLVKLTTSSRSLPVICTEVAWITPESSITVPAASAATEFPMMVTVPAAVIRLPAAALSVSPTVSVTATSCSTSAPSSRASCPGPGHPLSQGGCRLREHDIGHPQAPCDVHEDDVVRSRNGEAPRRHVDLQRVSSRANTSLQRGQHDCRRDDPRGTVRGPNQNGTISTQIYRAGDGSHGIQPQMSFGLFHKDAIVGKSVEQRRMDPDWCGDPLDPDAPFGAWENS